MTSPKVTVVKRGENFGGLSSSRTTEENTSRNFVTDMDEFHARTYVDRNIEGLGLQRALLDSDLLCEEGPSGAITVTNPSTDPGHWGDRAT